MKAVIQRVHSATVAEVHTQKVVGEISSGLFVLIGIKKGDTQKEALLLANKLKKLRIFEQTEGKMDKSVLDLKLPILLVSQFTLLANTKDGNRPSFIEAEEPTKARELYNLVIEELRRDLVVETGSFGQYMKITLSLDGPVTIVLDL